MSSYPPTPNMGLVLPIPGTTEGPEYAQEQTQAFRQVDEHDHTLGQGAPITPLALNINDDVTFNGNDAVDLRTTTFQSQESTLNDLQATYVVGGDLYYNNAAGVAVPITSGNSLAAGSIGGIGGLNLAPQTAAVNYDPGTETFAFTSAPNTAAILDNGPIVLRTTTANSHGITVAPASGIAADYNLTLPAAPPSTTKFLTMGNTGAVGFGDADNVTLLNTSGTLSVKDGGLTTAKYASLSVTRAKMAAVGQQVSSGQSGSFELLSPGSVTDIDNLSVTITTTGRPIMMMCISNANDVGYFSATSSTVLRFAVGGLVVGQTQIGTSGSVLSVSYPPGSMSYIYPTTADTYTIKVQAQVIAGSMRAFNLRLVAWEL